MKSINDVKSVNRARDGIPEMHWVKLKSKNNLFVESDLFVARTNNSNAGNYKLMKMKSIPESACCGCFNLAFGCNHKIIWAGPKLAVV